MIDSKRWENDILYKANHVWNAISCKAIHGLDGTRGWDDEILNEKKVFANSMCSGCKYGDNPEDCDYSDLLDDAMNVLGQLINEYQALKNREVQTQKRVQNIADNQLANAPNGVEPFHEFYYKQGLYAGLEMAYKIITEGRNPNECKTEFEGSK